MNYLALFFCLLVALAKRPLKPSEDPFYEAPANISSYSLGDIIDFRKAPNQVRALYAPLNIEAAWQLSVRSQNSREEPIAMVTTILIPYDANPTKLVSYQYAQDSSTMDCAASYSLLHGASMGTFVQQAETLLVQAMLSKGWYVVLPDYEGPDGAFGSGWQAGYATIDSLKAALKSGSFTGLSSLAKTALWGYSGGSFASTWAAGIQPDYSPELSDNLVGAAIGGWVNNFTDVLVTSDGALYAGLIPNILNGALKTDPGLQPVFERGMKSDKLSELYSRADDCLMTSVLKCLGEEFFGGDDPWTKQGWDFLRIPEIENFFLNNSIGLFENSPRPEIPLFLYHGIPDQIVPFNTSQRAYENYCDWGIESFEFAVSETTGHILEAVLGNGAPLAWLEKMLNGGEPVKGCKRTVRSSNVLYPDAEVNLYQVLRTIPSSFRGQKIGESTRLLNQTTIWTQLLQYSVRGLFALTGPLAI